MAKDAVGPMGQGDVHLTHAHTYQTDDIDAERQERQPWDCSEGREHPPVATGTDVKRCWRVIGVPLQIISKDKRLKEVMMMHAQNGDDDARAKW
jgi:hypothetical protein